MSVIHPNARTCYHATLYGPDELDDGRIGPDHDTARLLIEWVMVLGDMRQMLARCGLFCDMVPVPSDEMPQRFRDAAERAVRVVGKDYWGLRATKEFAEHWRRHDAREEARLLNPYDEPYKGFERG